MNEITRNAETIASEIISIKETARNTLQAIATGAAVEIGKRLREVKSLIPYGEWGEWLKTNVDYSERTAQNLMHVADENGRGGLERLQELSYTQTLQLIGLPAADREVFLNENNVEELSTRELRALVEQYKEDNKAQQTTIAGLEQELSQAHDGTGTGDTASDAQRKADEHSARERAEAAQRTAEEALEKAQKETAKARKEAETIQKTNQRYEDELQRLRRLEAEQTQMQETQSPAEVQATVATITPPEVQKELEELRERERRRETAAAEAAEAMKREGAEYTFRVLYEQFRGQFGKLQETLGQMAPENRGRYAAALGSAVEKMSEKLTAQSPETQEEDA